MRYLSLFAGIGGLEFGLKDHRCIGISEIKKTSIEIYNRHHPGVPNYGDITTMIFEDLPDFDLLLGGFPCQSFSLAGKRRGLAEGKDKKGAMVLYIHKLLQAKHPKYFVLENVKGILNHDSGKTFRKVFELFEMAGYHIRCVLLNSLYYGTAQNRERVLFLGSLKKIDYDRPVILDDSRRFKDVYEKDGDYKYIKETGKNNDKIQQLLIFNFELIGKYDRVGTLTTQEGCGEKAVYEKGKYRYLTPLECERLQGFPDGWTEGVSNNARYFALGNAVNCRVSDYLFNSYLIKYWEELSR